MIVSWEWLRDYVDLDASLAEETANRLMMTGLNLESITPAGSDLAIDLEVTSNRADCLGHIGIAREAAVITGRPLKIPAAAVRESSVSTASATSVTIECEDLCPRYVARVIRGVKVGPSPDWLRKRLETVGIASINNIVDITNYVLMECGQPLHAFDHDRLKEGRIVVRRAREGETIEAIDHREYRLTPQMCVIADAERPVAIAGVMGGASTEITTATRNVLIEVADFASMSIRATARSLSLHSDSSYRFERGIDPHQLDQASRRCCELILQLAGGELLSGPVYAGRPLPEVPAPVTLRFAQLKRVLGIDIPSDEAVRILQALGLTLSGTATADSAAFIVPSWRRRDLTREIDLIEEVVRIHGYDRIPEDAVVPLTISQKTLRDQVIERVAHVLTASGFYESVTLSFIDEKLAGLFQPRTGAEQLSVDHSSRRAENLLRQSLIPSLLNARRENERHGSFGVQLFEIAAVFLAARPGDPSAEPKMIGLVGTDSFSSMKGLLQLIAQRINPANAIAVQPSSLPQFVDGRGAEVRLNGQPWGWLGELDRSVTDQLDLRETCIAAEVDLALLESTASLRPQFTDLPRFPTVSRDLNFVLDEAVTWSDLEAAVRSAAGPLFESIHFSGQYRGPQLPPDRKSYLLTIHYRSPDRTLTAAEVDEAQQAVIAACETRIGAKLR